eukprot:CAMPEP_0113229596 /NCGR_PEP_ID=MMETSP0008_2-20120614/437_1 /TAXON_ID=97485 /ORGANISM="Prymnesium parvum" /LENGTH=88 /DNA_ID=CAMNT_0000076127 /DNA_START=424 /DNA_END=690 /DNA_ORIENTATION=- /assembly_acc=CAM_ASM_000153
MMASTSSRVPSERTAPVASSLDSGAWWTRILPARISERTPQSNTPIRPCSTCAKPWPGGWMPMSLVSSAIDFISALRFAHASANPGSP